MTVTFVMLRGSGCDFVMVTVWSLGCDSNVVMLGVWGVTSPSNSHSHIMLKASLVPKSNILEGGELGQGA